jgi:hypothetical protein
VAASRDALTTGFETPRADPFKYYRRLHVGATSWNVFAQLGVNPYYEPLGRPTSVDAHFTGAAAAITWNAVPGADGYMVIRHDGFVIVTAATNATDTTISAGSAYLYRVLATRAGAEPSPSQFSAPDLMTAISFTDDPLVAFSTAVKAVHVTQLRSAVNAVRTLAGLLPTTFSDPSLAGMPIRAAHINELRTALGTARTTLELPALAIAHPTLSIVRAVDVAELRDGVD